MSTSKKTPPQAPAGSPGGTGGQWLPGYGGGPAATLDQGEAPHTTDTDHVLEAPQDGSRAPFPPSTWSVTTTTPEGAVMTARMNPKTDICDRWDGLTGAFKTGGSGQRHCVTAQVAVAADGQTVTVSVSRYDDEPYWVQDAVTDQSGHVFVSNGTGSRLVSTLTTFRPGHNVYEALKDAPVPDNVRNAWVLAETAGTECGTDHSNGWCAHELEEIDGYPY